MAEREPLRAMLEFLKKLQNKDVQNVNPRKHPSAEDRMDDVAQRLEGRVAREHTKKLLSEDKKVHKNAVEATKAAKYSDAEIQNAHANVASVAAEVPTWLTADPAALRPEAAALANRLARLPKELQEDPRVLYHEASRAYWSTDWNSLTNEAARSVRESIQKTVDQAHLLASQNPSQYQEIATKDFDALWQGMDSKFDLYKTDRLPTEAEYTAEMKARTPPVEDNDIKRQYELLEKKLRQSQEQMIDRVNLKPEEEARKLQRLRDDLARGSTEETKYVEKYADKKTGEDRERTRHEILYDKEYADRYIAKIEKRIDLLDAQIKEDRNAQYKGREQRRGVDLDVIDWKDVAGRGGGEVEELMGLLNKSKSPQARRLAEWFLENQGKAGIPELQKQYEELGKLYVSGGILEDVRDSLLLQDKDVVQKLAELRQVNPNATAREAADAVGGVVIHNDELRASVEVDARLLDQLRRAMVSRAVQIRETGIGRSYWQDHKEAYDKMMSFDFKDYFVNPTNPNIDPTVELSNLDEIFYDILSVADHDPRGSFRETINLYKEADLEAFYSLLEKRLKQIQIDHPELTNDNISQVVRRYTSLRNAKEIAHNTVFISYNGDMEMLGKFAGTLLSGDVDFMYRNIAAVELAQHARESAFARIEADYGYLPSELFTGDKDVISRWEQFSRRELDLMLERGLLKTAGENGPRTLTETQRVNALEHAYAIDVLTLRHSDMITRAPDSPAYASKPYEKLGLDPIAAVFVKYETKKPQSAILYFVLTGDVKGTRGMLQDPNWSVNTALDMYFRAQNDPIYGKRIADIKNILDISGRFGVRSLWGVRRAGEMMSQEEFAQRGFAIKAADARSRITEAMRSSKQAEFMAKHPNNPARAAREFQKYMTSHDVVHHISDEAHAAIHTALEEGLHKVPLVFARRMRAYKGSPWELKRFDLMEQALGQEQVSGILGRQFGSLRELAETNPSGKGGEMSRDEAHLTGERKQQFQGAWDRLGKAADKLEGNLSLVQQKVVREGRLKLENSDFDIITDPTERAQALRYKDLIIESVEHAPAEQYNGKTQSFLEVLSDAYYNGTERFLLTTEDTRYELFDWSHMGDRGLLRGIMDAQAAIKGGLGLDPYLETMTAHPKMEDLVGTLRKEVFVPLASYDDGAAMEFCYNIALQTLRYYGEKNWASYSGPIGDVMSMGWIQDFFARHEKWGMLTSVNRALSDPTGESWGPNERFRFIHLINGANLIAKHNAWWAGAAYGKTAHALEDLTGSRPIHAAAEWGSYIMPAAGAAMLWQGTQESIDEEGKTRGGGH